ncbi:MAG TPA: universal stress protein [Flavisolibacter sp.]|nr:universal stress protein [Flavisolibacter sp.]
MTNILVPTDFTAASLKMAENALNSGNFEKCNLVLFHAFEMPSSPFDLLFSNYKDPSGELITESFRQACKQLKDEHAKRVGKIIIRCMNGDTRAVFRNFAEANEIDLIYCPEDYVFQPVHVRSVNPLYLFKKCAIPVLKNRSQKQETVFSPAYLSAIPVPAR